MISEKRIEILASDQPTEVWELRDLARQYLKLKAECDVLQSKDAAIGYAYMKERAERAEAKYEEEVQMWRNACELMNRAEAERDELRALLKEPNNHLTDTVPEWHKWLVKWLHRVDAALAKEKPC